MGILNRLFGKNKEVDNSRQGTLDKQSSKPDSAPISPQNVFIPEKEAGALFTFNFKKTLDSHSTQVMSFAFNPQRYFCQSILRSFSPAEINCPHHIQEAFYEMRVSMIDLSTWEKLFYYTRIGSYYLRPGVSKFEQDFVASASDCDISELGFIPYIIAIWSDTASSFSYIHDWLGKNNIEGYIGYKTLDIVGTIEEFHEMCRDVDLGWDAIVHYGEYQYLKNSDHPLKPEVMAEMGFKPQES